MKKNPGLSPEKLGFKALPERRMGKPVFLKICPSTLKTKSEFVDARQRYASEDDIRLNGGKFFGDYFLGALANYDEKDGKICRKVNRDVLVWMAQTWNGNGRQEVKHEHTYRL